MSELRSLDIAGRSANDRDMTDTKRMDAKRQKIVEAAMRVFERYGYARTTMADIAAEAGMARPSLYYLYPGKEQVFGAVRDAYEAERMEVLRLGLPQRGGFAERLRFVCDTWLTDGFERLQVNPDARDVMFMPEAVQTDSRFMQCLADLIAEEARKGGKEIDVQRLALVLTYSLVGIMLRSRSLREFLQLVEGLVEMADATLAAAPSRAETGAAR